MQTLNRAIEKCVEGISEEILLKLVASKLQNNGVELSTKEQRKLVRHILAGHKTPFKSRGWQFWKSDSFVLEFTDADATEVSRYGDRVLAAFPAMLEEVSAKVASDILKTLKRRWPDERKAQASQLSGFRSGLQERWGEPISQLQLLLTMSRELGQSINDEVRCTGSSASPNLTEVLMRLHARGCQITDEIICLLSSGFADGAMARWRTLDEIAVVSLFLAEHGEETATRYIEHQSVEAWKAAEKYQECHERIGYESFSPEELENIRTNHDAAISKYGKVFKGDYGWAASAFQGKEPKFSDIEKSVRLDHLRAHYRMAGHNVHANPRGAFFKLGLIDEQNMLLAGASNAGLADPGHCAAVTLLQISTTLFRVQMTLDNLIAMHMMTSLAAEIGDSFYAAHRKLVDDEDKRRGTRTTRVV